MSPTLLVIQLNSYKEWNMLTIPSKLKYVLALDRLLSFWEHNTIASNRQKVRPEGIRLIHMSKHVEGLFGHGR